MLHVCHLRAVVVNLLASHGLAAQALVAFGKAIIHRSTQKDTEVLAAARFGVASIVLCSSAPFCGCILSLSARSASGLAEVDGDALLRGVVVVTLAWAQRRRGTGVLPDGARAANSIERRNDSRPRRARRALAESGTINRGIALARRNRFAGDSQGTDHNRAHYSTGRDPGRSTAFAGFRRLFGNWRDSSPSRHQHPTRRVAPCPVYFDQILEHYYRHARRGGGAAEDAKAESASQGFRHAVIDGHGSAIPTGSERSAQGCRAAATLALG